MTTTLPALDQLGAMLAAATAPMPFVTETEAAAWGNAEKSAWLEKFNAWMDSVRAAQKEIVARLPALLACARELKNARDTICATYCDEADDEVPHCEECQDATKALQMLESGR